MRDGIISHCGEIDENKLRPREECIDLYEYNYPNEYAPYTWEGCVVKISDKISYLGRDIIDAVTLGILDEDLDELKRIFHCDINNSVIISDLVYDLCRNSSPETGLCFSEEKFKMLNELKQFNYKNIYLSDKTMASNQYFKLVLNTIYDFLKDLYKNRKRALRVCAELVFDFEEWLSNYWNWERSEKNKNLAIFTMEDETSFYRAIIYYISGMTDNYAIETFNKIISF